MDVGSLNALMNASLVPDQALSYLLVSWWRGLALMLLCASAYRAAQVLRALPGRAHGQTLREYFNSPWWRTPALLIAVAMVGFALLIGLQIPAAGLVKGQALGQLTPYNALGHGLLMMFAWGVLSACGHLLTRVHAER